jgi:hypothetical protein
MFVYRPSMAGEVTADFPSLERKDGDWVKPGHDGLEQALQWARKTLDDHPGVDHVVIQQSVQTYEGQPWKTGRFVKKVTRADTGPATPGAAPARATRQRGPARARRLPPGSTPPRAKPQ